MKSYEEIAQSVLKKSEERMAEKKRSGLSFNKKVAIASTLCAACLCGIGFWKLDSVRNAMDKTKLPQIIDTPHEVTATTTSAVQTTTAATTVTAVVTADSLTTQITLTTDSSQNEITSAVNVKPSPEPDSTVSTQAVQQTNPPQTAAEGSATTKSYTTAAKHTTAPPASTTAKSTVTTAKQTTTTARRTTTAARHTTTAATHHTTTAARRTMTTVHHTTTTARSVEAETTASYITTTDYTILTTMPIPVSTTVLTSEQTPVGSETNHITLIDNITETTVNQYFNRIYINNDPNIVYVLDYESDTIDYDFTAYMNVMSADSQEAIYYAFGELYIYNSSAICIRYSDDGPFYYYRRETYGNTAQSTSDDFARHKLAYFPSSCTEIS